jgi:hypothetical protein
MFMFDVYNFENLTNKELITRIEDFTAKLTRAQQCNMDCRLIDQIRNTLGMCHSEYAYREMKQQKVDKNTVAWDMESYLNIDKDKKNEQTDIPRWKSAALNELSNTSSEPWNITNSDDFD